MTDIRRVVRVTIPAALYGALVKAANNGKTEVGMYGRLSVQQSGRYFPDSMYLTDVCVPEQECTGSTTEIDGLSWAKTFAQWVESGSTPAEAGRFWIHTHPKGMGPTPSSVDYATLRTDFGKYEWAIMMIIATNGDYSIEFGGELGSFLVPKLSIDWLVGPEFTWDLAPSMATAIKERTHAIAKWRENVGKHKGKGNGRNLIQVTRRGNTFWVDEQFATAEELAKYGENALWSGGACCAGGGGQQSGKGSGSGDNEDGTICCSEGYGSQFDYSRRSSAWPVTTADLAEFLGCEITQVTDTDRTLWEWDCSFWLRSGKDPINSFQPGVS